MLLSVVIPVFNEEKTIVELIDRVLKEKTPKEIIVVDDGSTDGTWNLVQSAKFSPPMAGSRPKAGKVQSCNSKLKVLKNEKNLGKGAAVRKGIDNATGDVLIIQDADLEYNPDDYKKLLDPIIKNKTDVVYGTRLKTMKFRIWGDEKTVMPLHYLCNRFLSSMANVLYCSNLTDMETCFKMMTKNVYRKLDLVSNGFEIEPEITAKILKKGFKIMEVPITTKPRSYKEGKKIKARDAIRAVQTLLTYRFKN